MKTKINVEIKVIPGHIAYTASYDIKDYNDFFNEDTGENILQSLSDQVEGENPDIKVPDIPNDYNYFTHEAGKPITSPMHVQYFDMVNGRGKDCQTYKFVTVDEITAATLRCKGPFEQVGEGYERIYKWIETHGYEIAGDGRSEAIHGPWDRSSREEYELEIQIPVKKK